MCKGIRITCVLALLLLLVACTFHLRLDRPAFIRSRVQLALSMMQMPDTWNVFEVMTRFPGRQWITLRIDIPDLPKEQFNLRVTRLYGNEPDAIQVEFSIAGRFLIQIKDGVCVALPNEDNLCGALPAEDWEGFADESFNIARLKQPML